MLKRKSKTISLYNDSSDRIDIGYDEDNELIVISINEEEFSFEADDIKEIVSAIEEVSSE